MGIGTCCCGGTGCEPERYFGNSPLEKLDFLKDTSFKFKNKIVDEITSKKISFPNFVYDVHKDVDTFWIAGGDYGAIEYSVHKNGEVYYKERVFEDDARSSTKEITGYDGEKFWAGNSEGSRYGYEQKEFGGVYGLETYKNYLLLAKGVDGIYSYEKSKRSLKQIITIDDLKSWGLDSEIEETKTIFYKLKIIGDLLVIATTGYDSPVIDFAEVSDQVELGVEFDWFTWDSNNQPETSITKYNYQINSQSLNSIGLIIVNIDEVLYKKGVEIEPESNIERKREEIESGKKNVFKNILVHYNPIGYNKNNTIDKRNDHYINHINANGDEILICSGRRFEFSFGYDNFNKLQDAKGVLTTLVKDISYEEYETTNHWSNVSIDILKNTFTSDSVTKQNVTFLKSTIQGSYAFVLTVDYNDFNGLTYYQKPTTINSDGEEEIGKYWTQIYTESDSDGQQQEVGYYIKDLMQWEMCGDFSASCFAYNPDLIQFVSVPGGKEGVKVDDVSNPTERIYGVICPQVDFSDTTNLQFTSSKGTEEMIAASPTDFAVSPLGIGFTLWNGGYISPSIDKEGQEGDCRFRSYVKYSGDCSKFLQGEENQNSNDDDFLSSRDLNEEVNMAFTHILRFKSYTFLIDSIQFVANGSGPMVYDPSSQSISPRRFVSLLKNFQMWSGILRLKKNKKKEEDSRNF